MAELHGNKSVGGHPSMAETPHNASASGSQACGARRLQLSRKAGWKLADHSTNCKIVDRRGGYGNPWGVHPTGRRWMVLLNGHFPTLGEFDAKPEAQGLAVKLFERWLTDDEFAATLPEMGRGWILDSLDELVGKDLACWCAEGTPCHADVLLRLANGGER